MFETQGSQADCVKLDNGNFEVGVHRSAGIRHTFCALFSLALPISESTGTSRPALNIVIKTQDFLVECLQILDHLNPKNLKSQLIYLTSP